MAYSVATTGIENHLLDDAVALAPLHLVQLPYLIVLFQLIEHVDHVFLYRLKERRLLFLHRPMLPWHLEESLLDLWIGRDQLTLMTIMEARSRPRVEALMVLLRRALQLAVGVLSLALVCKHVARIQGLRRVGGRPALLRVASGASVDIAAVVGQIVNVDRRLFRELTAYWHVLGRAPVGDVAEDVAIS